MNLSYVESNFNESSTVCFSAFWFFVAYTIFGSRATEPDWLPGWKNNYLSWSFGLSVVGGIQLFISSVLFFVTAKRRLGLEVTDQAEVQSSVTSRFVVERHSQKSVSVKSMSREVSSPTPSEVCRLHLTEITLV